MLRVAVGCGERGGRGEAVGSGFASDRWAWSCGAAGSLAAAAFSGGAVAACVGTPIRVRAVSGSCEKTVRRTTAQFFRQGENSPATATCGGRRRSIHEHIIGRGMAVARLRFAVGRSGFRLHSWPGEILRMIEEQASYVGRRALMQPGIEQLHDFFPKIGGYFTQHFPRGFWPIQNMGEMAVVYCFFLYISAHGAGPFSVDALIGKRGATSV
jgi:hypothetical protein